MGVDIETLKPGDGVTFPKPGQTVTAHYTGAFRAGAARATARIPILPTLRSPAGCPRQRSDDPLRPYAPVPARFPPTLTSPRPSTRPSPGTLMDGSKFDSSKDRGRPFQFVIGQGMVIKGWDEGMMQMSVGQHAKLTCTPDYAYGPRGFPPVIPPNSTLIFEVELLGVQ